MQPANYLAAVSRYHSYINSAKEILESYQGNEPFAAYIKKHFSANKKYGAKDRKQISHLCYCFFRLGKMEIHLSAEQRILAALFFCSERHNEILAAIKPEWDEKAHLSVEEKLLIINYSLLITDVFPWKDELSTGIDYQKFCKSFFTQPELFIRLRPGKEKAVLHKLSDAGIEYRVISETCVVLFNATKIDELIELDKEAVIQDYNSQQTGRFIKSELLNFVPIDIGTEITVWDCCAASGGKSIMTYDLNPHIDLVVSDIRESILANLKKRFQRAGINNYKSFIIDLNSEKSETRSQHLSGLKSEIIICDAPCTGSGTWSRTPEQLYFFKEKEIERYASLQKRIVSNAIGRLVPGGSFIYITCSVFRKENEDLVKYIQENFGLQLKQMELLKGYDKKADSMFVAVLSLPKQ